MDSKCSLTPINLAAQLLYQQSHGDDRLHILTFWDHHTTRSHQEATPLTIGQGHRDLLVVVLGFTQSHRTQWVCGTRVNQSLLASVGNLVDLEAFELYSIQLLLKTIRHLLFWFPTRLALGWSRIWSGQGLQHSVGLLQELLHSWSFGPFIFLQLRTRWRSVLPLNLLHLWLLRRRLSSLFWSRACKRHMFWAPAIPASSSFVLLVMRPLTSLSPSATLVRKVKLALPSCLSFFASFCGRLPILLQLSEFRGLWLFDFGLLGFCGILRGCSCISPRALLRDRESRAAHIHQASGMRTAPHLCRWELYPPVVRSSPGWHEIEVLCALQGSSSTSSAVLAVEDLFQELSLLCLWLDVANEANDVELLGHPGRSGSLDDLQDFWASSASQKFRQKVSDDTEGGEPPGCHQFATNFLGKSLKKHGCNPSFQPFPLLLQDFLRGFHFMADPVKRRQGHVSFVPWFSCCHRRLPPHTRRCWEIWDDGLDDQQPVSKDEWSLLGLPRSQYWKIWSPWPHRLDSFDHTLVLWFIEAFVHLLQKSIIRAMNSKDRSVKAAFNPLPSSLGLWLWGSAVSFGWELLGSSAPCVGGLTASSALKLRGSWASVFGGLTASLKGRPAASFEWGSTASFVWEPAASFVWGSTASFLGSSGVENFWSSSTRRFSNVSILALNFWFSSMILSNSLLSSTFSEDPGWGMYGYMNGAWSPTIPIPSSCSKNKGLAIGYSIMEGGPSNWPPA